MLKKSAAQTFQRFFDHRPTLPANSSDFNCCLLKNSWQYTPIPSTYHHIQASKNRKPSHSKNNHRGTLNNPLYKPIVINKHKQTILIIQYSSVIVINHQFLGFPILSNHHMPHATPIASDKHPSRPIRVSVLPSSRHGALVLPWASNPWPPHLLHILPRALRRWGSSIATKEHHHSWLWREANERPMNFEFYLDSNTRGITTSRPCIEKEKRCRMSILVFASSGAGCGHQQEVFLHQWKHQCTRSFDLWQSIHHYKMVPHNPCPGIPIDGFFPPWFAFTSFHSI